MMRLLTSNFLKTKITNTKYFISRNLSDKVQNATTKETATDTSFIPHKLHAPNNIEKTILVWTKMFKSKEDIPKKVPIETIEKARNKARIKTSNYLIVLTAIGCIVMAINGKRALERGESLTKMNLDWHKQIKEESKK